MRKLTVAVAVLLFALICFQIGLTFGEETAETSGTIDRSTTYDVVIIPKSGPPIVLKARYGQWVGDINIYDYLKNDSQQTIATSNPPGTYYLYPTVTFSEGKDTYKTVYTFSCDGVGRYDLRATLTLSNPSNKWRATFHALDFFGNPNNLLQSPPSQYLAPAFVVVDRGYTGSGVLSQYIFITQTTGAVQVVMECHSVITDINNDKIVDILDISAVARQFGKRLSGSSDPLYLYDMDCNYVIDLTDVILVAIDFGFHVPP